MSSGKNSPFRKIDKDKILIYWQMLGGEKGTVFAMDDYNEKQKERPEPKLINGIPIDKNTEISAGRINDAKGAGGGKYFLGNYIVLDEKYSGMDLNKKK